MTDSNNCRLLTISLILIQKEAKSFASSDSVFTDGVAAFFDMADDPRCDLLGAGSSCNENINW